MDRDQAHRQLELLNRIADALEKGNTTKAVELSGERNKELTAKGILDVVGKITDDYASKHPVDKLQGSNEIPGFEGTLDALNDLTSDFDNDDGHNDYLIDLVKEMSKEQYVKFFLDRDFGFALSDTTAFNNHIYDLGYEEVLDCIKSARNILDTKDPYSYDNDLREHVDGIVNDSDHDIRTTAQYYFENLNCNDLGNPDAYKFKSKKDCILDYVTNEFGILGARYTDIIKFAYYLGSPNAPKYTSANRGYYSCAFNVRMSGYLIQGGKDQLVKGINNEGDERYFALSFVESATEYWKRIE